MARRREATIGELQEKLQRDPKSLTPSELAAIEKVNRFKKASAPQSPEARWFCTRQEAAQLLACSVMNVDKYTQEKKLTKDDSGKLDIRSICELLRNRSRVDDDDDDDTHDDGSAPAVPGGESLSKQLKREQARFRKLKSDLAEIELRLKNGEAVLTEQVVAETNRALMSLRDNLLDAGRRLPEQCQGLDLRNMAEAMEKEFRRILTDFNLLLSTPLPDDWKAKYLVRMNDDNSAK